MDKIETQCTRRGERESDKQLLSDRTPRVRTTRRRKGLYQLPNTNLSFPDTADLGATLGSLPLELLNLILGELDVKSFSKFRKVNKQAMRVADQLVIYRKIRKNHSAVAAVELALVRKSAARFTIAQLFETLCQRTCDTCGNVAAYIDVLNLSRQCMNVSGGCQPRHVPQTAGKISSIYKVKPHERDRLMMAKNTFESGGKTYYDGEAAAKLSRKSVPVDKVPHQDLGWLVVVCADHLKHDNYDSEQVALCKSCIDKYKRTHFVDWEEFVDLTKVTLCFAEDLEQHEVQFHPEIKQHMQIAGK